MIDFDVPKGYKPVAFRTPKTGELFIDSINGTVEEGFITFRPNVKCLIVEKIEPKRIILERVEETVNNPMHVKQGEFFECSGNGLIEFTGKGCSAGEYVIWRRVENDTK